MSGVAPGSAAGTGGGSWNSVVEQPRRRHQEDVGHRMLGQPQPGGAQQRERPRGGARRRRRVPPRSSRRTTPLPRAAAQAPARRARRGSGTRGRPWPPRAGSRRTWRTPDGRARSRRTRRPRAARGTGSHAPAPPAACRNRTGSPEPPRNRCTLPPVSSRYSPVGASSGTALPPTDYRSTVIRTSIHGRDSRISCLPDASQGCRTAANRRLWAATNWATAFRSGPQDRALTIDDQPLSSQRAISVWSASPAARRGPPPTRRAPPRSARDGVPVACSMPSASRMSFTISRIAEAGVELLGEHVVGPLVLCRAAAPAGPVDDRRA